ncbi:GGDEF domain-containing protein [Actinoplanes campanulatus]|uniref:GGDEF domain-containing protein n=1 Tax=Actinoplanes campanulatus TaxID=113559 RepID=A0A7W5FDU4_9ACTN|nr:GGDEF domain-containing protein [Actinoplanes campanulatus]MBB3094808.1 GGDEF domain-containing protein [Actinoplanes campanulatus]GGN07553.1 hypothetical protein GCM10010109_15960 [Actinoplanes campanulatus]GID36103.1 hypothetical protein Aca09nite_26090 [Actinoplanes campanulatus]
MPIRLRDLTSDPLTGAANRRAFDAEIGRAVNRAGPDDPLALVMIDVDHFKTINDTWGHATGDQALRTRLSIGIAVAPDHATGPDDLQRVADAALYRAKEGGRGRSTMAGPARLAA